MHTKPRAILLLVLAVLAVGSVGAGLLSADECYTGTIMAPSSAPGTLPAADHRPPPWQVAPAGIPANAPAVVQGLHEIARTVTCMVDGELVKNILTERAMEKAFTVDPKDQWAGSDNWDYNHEPFIKTKQTLERAACLAPGQVGCTLYMPSPVKPELWHILMNTIGGGRQMMSKADLIAGKPDPELLQVFSTGQRVTVSKNEGVYSVLTPIYDSLGNIVAVVEVFARQDAFVQPRQ